MKLIASPWDDTFASLLRRTTHSALIACPYITSRPLQTVSAEFSKLSSPRIEILTNLSTENLVLGSIDAVALLGLYRKFPDADIRHLPGLHAKVYLMDDERAVVTSANLTEGGLFRNFEYGVEIEEPQVVVRIAADIREYGTLGSVVTLSQLEQLAVVAQELRERQASVLRSARAQLRTEFERKVAESEEMLRSLRARPGESTNAIFSRTILYLLRRESITTAEMHSAIKSIHPDLCDDSIERIIGGVHFGKRWKHMVRNAQQHLKSQGLIVLDGSKWHVTG